MDLVIYHKQIMEEGSIYTPVQGGEVLIRAVKFCIQIESDWPEMRQIWDFLRSVSVHFGLHQIGPKWNKSGTF